MLISKGASWKEKDNEGQSVLHLSTRHKSSKCLSLLLKLLEVGEVDDQDKNKVSLLAIDKRIEFVQRVLIAEDTVTLGCVIRQFRSSQNADKTRFQHWNPRCGRKDSSSLGSQLQGQSSGRLC